MTTSTKNTTMDRSAQESGAWPATVSRYLIERQSQTQSAYRDQLQSQSEPSNSQKLLFTAIFEVLVQRLEEGHTVLELSAAMPFVSDFIPAETESSGVSGVGVIDALDQNGLMAWQQHLLQPLLQSVLGYLDESAAVEGQGLALLASPDLWPALIQQQQLSQYDLETANRRYRACLSLYRTLIALAQASNSIENSLSDFNQLLKNTPLISFKNNKNNNQIETTNTPIICHSDDQCNLTLWLHRTWQAELTLAKQILKIKNQSVTALSITPNPMLNDEQKRAIEMANHCAFSIITGGPGTGKTFTVAQLVMALWQGREGGMIDDFGQATLALAAPTGKAAQRMQESLQAAIVTAGIQMQLPEAKTIHRLLGINQNGQPRYHLQNPLSEDIIIVDEASMLGVELANHLVSAIKPSARLILLGDANQLAAVDAGAVLADLCNIPSLNAVHQRLDISRRFTSDSGIGKLARLINQPDTQMSQVWSLLSSEESLAFYSVNEAHKNDYDSINNSLSKINTLKNLQKKYSKYIKKSQNTLTKIKKANSVPTSEYSLYLNELITSLNTFKVLTAGHHGSLGDHEINHHLSQQHRQLLKLPLSKSTWYHGRPIMILQNNYELGLFNGDIGICIQTKGEGLQVFFENKSRGMAINRLSDDMVATAYAMTIHKSQGSEFDHVAICFDDQNSRLLSQELIYTAVTRAKKQVSIFSTPSALTRALKTPTIRQTGLALQFAQLEGND